MEKEDLEISLPQIVKMMRKHIIAILIFTCVGGIVSFAISQYAIAKTYISTVKLYVFTSTSADDNYSNDINELNYAQKVVNTYIEMLQTDSFLKNVQEQSGVNMDFGAFKKAVTFSTLNDTEVFKADVSAHDPNVAKKIADTISDLAPSTIAQFKEGASLKIVDPAVLPDKPSSPNVLMNTMVGFLLGLFLPIIYFVLKESMDVRIKGEEDITEHYNLAVLASIPAFTKEFANEKPTLTKSKKRG